MLISTSTPCQQVRHVICHFNFFHNWVNGRGHFKKSGIDLKTKSIYGPNQKMVQNIGTKNVKYIIICSVQFQSVRCIQT